MKQAGKKSSRLERRHSCIAVRTAINLLSEVGGSPLAAVAVKSLKEGRYRDYLDMEISPHSYSDWDEFMRDYLSVELMSKFPNFDVGIDRDGVAIDKFLASEQACIQARKNLADLRSGLTEWSNPAHAIFHSARGKISRLLGPFNWSRCANYFGFGPGASIGVLRSHGDSWYKFGDKTPTSTEGCAVLAEAYIPGFRAWYDHVTDYSSRDLSTCIKRVEGNSITTVPKNAKTNRIIAIEPSLNMFFQKGIGGLIRSKLKRVDIDLDTQELNQRLAQAGSADGSLATIDLASASDTISLSLVEDLLPPDWVEAIKLCRSPVGVLPSGQKIYYRKVSSMGNGFTFELESLIFWALSSSVVSYLNESDHRLAVYGDDIIVPTGCAELLIDILRIAGFQTNSKKSYVDGPFRESCGKHFFSGRDVTPFYIRKAIDRTEADLWLCNSIRRWAYRNVGIGYGCSASCKSAWESVLQHIPPYLRRPRLPLMLDENTPSSDTALGGDFDEALPRKLPNSLEGYSTKHLLRRYSVKRVNEDPALAKVLFLRRSGTARTGSVCVDLAEIPTARYKLEFVKLTVQRWWDVGPWVG